MQSIGGLKRQRFRPSKTVGAKWCACTGAARLNPSAYADGEPAVEDTVSLRAHGFRGRRSLEPGVLGWRAFLRMQAERHG